MRLVTQAQVACKLSDSMCSCCVAGPCQTLAGASQLISTRPYWQPSPALQSIRALVCLWLPEETQSACSKRLSMPYTGLEQKMGQFARRPG